MSIKTEERLKLLFEEQHKKNTDNINDKVSGVFLYGVIVGIIISYSGILGYCAGVVSGIILANKLNLITSQFTVKASYVFDNILAQIKSLKTDKSN